MRGGIVLDKNTKAKIIVLPMIAYTSGFLHAGHVRSYTACDAMHRGLKLNGYDSHLPFGYDAHGLPTEIKAREEGLNPVKGTEQCVRKMDNDLAYLNYDFYHRRINTSMPDYYLQQQGLFVQLHRYGLIYRSNAIVNWDPIEETTLANEQVQDGLAIRTGNRVLRKNLEQGFFKLSKYAEELQEGLERLNWDQGVKNGQANGISFSKCHAINMNLNNQERKVIIPKDPYLRINKCYCNDEDLVGRSLEIDDLKIPIVLNKHLDNGIIKLIGSEQSLNNTSENILLDRKDLEDYDFYLLRDWCVSRQRSFGCPIPACYCEECGWVVDESLIVESPINGREYRKNLSMFEDGGRVKCPRCDKHALRDSDTLDVLFDSSWYPVAYFHDVRDLRSEYFPPVSIYIGGSEHTNGHLIYIRAMFKAMNDIGLKVDREPILNFIPNGMINSQVFKLNDQYIYPEKVYLDKVSGKYLSVDNNEEIELCGVEKMSKSKKNVVRLENLIERYSNSEIRLTILSNYPIQKDYQWESSLIRKANRSLKKFRDFLDLASYNHSLDFMNSKDTLPEDLRSEYEEVNRMYMRLEFNKIIAKAHEIVNTNDRSFPNYILLSIILWPLIPNLIEEILGNEGIENLITITGEIRG